MSETINKALVEFIPRDEVRLNPANSVLNEFHYGEIDNLSIIENEKGIIVRPHFSDTANEMSYLVQFDTVSGGYRYWFLEHELY